jgi:CRISPR system Cascade subunit CasC
MPVKFVQVHTLTNYPASLLNRDDAGFAKRMPFGGAVRTRISSQCLKRHWRTYQGDHGLATIPAPESIRSRVAFERFVVQPLVLEGASEEAARAAAAKLVGKVFGSEAKQQKTETRKGSPRARVDGERPEVIATPQVTVLGRPELDYLRTLAKAAIDSTDGTPAKIEKKLDELMRDEKALKENIRALNPGSLEAGLGAALFGRMVTGDILSRCDAAIHVAHAVTVHSQMTESDYFTAIDDLVREDGEQGSGHINASELTSGLFYGYLVVDVDGLLANVGGDSQLAGDVVDRLVHMVATVSPGAKKGSTAPYAYSHLVLVEAGKAQPRTLQNAFIEPVPTSGNLVANAYAALREHLSELDTMYASGEARAHAGLQSDGLFEQRMPLGELAEWAKGQVVR